MGPLVRSLRPVIVAVPPKRHQPHLAGLPGLEADGRAGRDVKPQAEGAGAVEIQGLVNLEEMVMRADLHRPVAGVDHGQLDGLTSRGELDLALHRHDLPRH